MALMTCAKCGAQWDTASTPPMAFFNSSSPDPRNAVSPADLLAAGEDIIFCPKCPMPRLDDAMKRGDRKGDDAEPR